MLSLPLGRKRAEQYTAYRHGADSGGAHGHEAAEG